MVLVPVLWVAEAGGPLGGLIRGMIVHARLTSRQEAETEPSRVSLLGTHFWKGATGHLFALYGGVCQVLDYGRRERRARRMGLLGKGACKGCLRTGHRWTDLYRSGELCG